MISKRIIYFTILLGLALRCAGQNDPFSSTSNSHSADDRQAIAQKKPSEQTLYLLVYRLWPNNELHGDAVNKSPPDLLRRTMGYDEMALLRLLSKEGIDFISVHGSGVFFSQFFSSREPTTLRGRPSSYLGIVHVREALPAINESIGKFYPVNLIEAYEVGPTYFYMMGKPINPAPEVYKALGGKPVKSD